MSDTNTYQIRLLQLKFTIETKAPVHNGCNSPRVHKMITDKTSVYSSRKKLFKLLICMKRNTEKPITSLSLRHSSAMQHFASVVTGIKQLQCTSYFKNSKLLENQIFQHNNQNRQKTTNLQLTSDNSNLYSLQTNRSAPERQIKIRSLINITNRPKMFTPIIAINALHSLGIRNCHSLILQAQTSFCKMLLLK